MKPKLETIEKDFDKNQKTFQQQTPKTKELQLLKDQAEKTTGEESLSVNKTIRDKSQ